MFHAPRKAILNNHFIPGIPLPTSAGPNGTRHVEVIRTELSRVLTPAQWSTYDIIQKPDSPRTIRRLFQEIDTIVKNETSARNYSNFHTWETFLGDGDDGEWCLETNGTVWKLSRHGERV
ncbi:hypothetical protein NX059_010059 [Plenodomus lindquistii]|nr:hypothetical protein NX059_010059 [Plenodomus lindquistii]